MRTLLIDYPQRITQDEYDKMLLNLSTQRLEKVLSYRNRSDRVQSVMAYNLLTEGLGSIFGISERPEFAFNPCGKPFIESRPVCELCRMVDEKGILPEAHWNGSG